MISTRNTLRAALGGIALSAACATVAFAQMGNEQSPAGAQQPAGTQRPAMQQGNDAMQRGNEAMRQGGNAMPGGGGRMAGDRQVQAALTKIKADPSTAGDKLFVLNNAAGNMFEAEFSKLVASKVEDPKVKELAQMVGSDHAQANEKLKGIAQKMDLELPTALPSEKLGKLDVMAALPPADLAKSYLMMQRAIHAHDVTMFADHATMAKDGELKSYIEETLPKLKAHGAHINQCAKDMNAAASDTPADSIKE